MIGVGVGECDVHKLTEDRDLILGGVKIPWEKGLLGHSDADVVVHAIMDALLGAAALRDIGRHFPDRPTVQRCISSIKLLQHVGKLLEEHMYVVNNIDATIIAQKPKLLPYIDTMIQKCGKGPSSGKQSGEYQSNDRGRSGIYRKHGGNFRRGYLCSTMCRIL